MFTGILFDDDEKSEKNYNKFPPCRGHEFPVWCIDESSNGCYAVTGSKDTTARLWSYERKFPVKIYPGHSQDVDVSC